MSGQILGHQRSINATMLTATVIAVARTVLLAVPEPYPWMSEVGDVLYDVSLAFATAWLFQWLVIARPAKQERNRLDAILAPKIDRLIYIGANLADVIAVAAGRPVGSFKVDANEITNVCAKAKPSDQAPGWGSTWAQVLRHFGKQADEARARLTPLYARFDPILLQALTAEDDAMDSLLRMLRLADAQSSANLSRLSDPMTEWLTSIDMLRDIRLTTIAPTRALPTTTPLEKGKISVPIDEVVKQLEEIKQMISS